MQSNPADPPAGAPALDICLSIDDAFRPAQEVLLLNGPGTCLPLCLAAVLLQVLCLLPPVRIIFVESYCRVQSLSLTGKIIYASRLADSFLVQWPTLAEKLPRARFVGRLV
eukprot:SAG11_NODE_1189_length_5576_cov_3.002739_2_plen_111_part_00